jgi:ABC-type transporter Mla MlaB component
MPTRITQIERPGSETSAIKDVGENCDRFDRTHPENATSDPEIVPTVFKVEGTLYLRDAELLEKICRDVGNQKRPVTLELAGLSYLDSDSAAVLCRLKREQNVTLEGLHLFIEKIVELTEESEKASKYLPKFRT